MALKTNTGASEEVFYRTMLRRRTIIIMVLLSLLLVLFLLNISIGSSNISMEEILRAIILGQGQGHTVMIIRKIRVPMSLMAILVGASLGMGGCEIQTILKNPIASPYTLGITNAATFGAALGLILDKNIFRLPEAAMITGNAFIFALLASSIIYMFSLKPNSGKNTIVLFGIALNFLFNALTMILQYISDDEDLKSLVFWNMGSMLKANWTKCLIVLLAFLLAFFIFYKNAWKLTAMTLDDTKAQSLGVNTHRIRRMVILLTSLVTAFAVSFVGSIGFVGLIAPHIARQLVGEDQRFFMPVSAIMGSLVVSFAFVVSKLVIPGVILPIGLVTAIVGIPVFLAMIFRKVEDN